MLHGTEPRVLGHNPAGALMVLALIATLLAIIATGLVLNTTAFRGSPGANERYRAGLAKPKERLEAGRQSSLSNELLHPLAVIHFACIQVAQRIDGQVVDPMELAGVTA